MLATLRLGQLVDVVRQLLEVALLLGELLLQLQQLFALTPADGVVLVGLLALLEGVTLAAGLGRGAGVAGRHGAVGGREGSTGGRAGEPAQGGRRRLGESLAEHCVYQICDVVRASYRASMDGAGNCY